jgi:hypothetical protein
MVVWHEKGSAFLQRAQTIQAHGIQSLEDVPVFTMLRNTPMLFDKTLDFLEARDDAFLARRASALLLGLGEFVEFGAQFVEISHSVPRP